MRSGLFVVLLFTCQHLIHGDKPRARRHKPEVFGVRVNSGAAKVTNKEAIYLTVFGTQLPPDGYFLTTTDRCEDSDSDDIPFKMKIHLSTTAAFSNAVRLEAPDGVEFSEKFSTFQLCNKGATSVNKVLLQLSDKNEEHGFLTPAVIIIICVITLIISSYCSGANFAYMRMSINDMALIMDNGEEPHKTHARKIIRYRKQSNWLICTMAVMNILVNTIFTNTISLLLENRKYGEILKYAVPTILIVLLAEILPQSVCNRNGLRLAAKTRHITLLLFIICAPVAWPLSKLIDFVLGREVREIYSEDKLKALIKVQSKKMEEAAQGDILARIADFPKKTVEDMMTPMEDAFIISSSEKLDVKLLVTILEKGFTRIPVFEEKNRFNLFAMLNVKDLATMKFDHRSTVQQFMSMVDVSRTQMRFVLAAQRGESVMYEMMKGDHHLCAVIRFSYGRYRVVGLITFEDVIEEVFGDIEDDSDKMWNNRRAGVHKDQQTLDWFRTTESDQPSGLGVNATLRLIQTVFEACPLLMTLGYDVLRLKALLSPDNLFHAKEDELLAPRNNRKMLIFFSGTITVSGGRTTTYRLDANRADFRPYIWGKCLVKRVFKERLLSLCLHDPLSLPTIPRPVKIRVVTKASYYEISSCKILNGLRDPEGVGYDFNVMFTPPSEPLSQGNAPRAYSADGVYEIDSTQSSVREEARRNTTPKRNSERMFRVLTPRRLRNKLLTLKSFPGSKEPESNPSDTDTDDMLVQETPDATNRDRGSRPGSRESARNRTKAPNKESAKTKTKSAEEALSKKGKKQNGKSRRGSMESTAPLLEAARGSKEMNRSLSRVLKVSNLLSSSTQKSAEGKKKKKVLSFLRRKNQ